MDVLLTRSWNSSLHIRWQTWATVSLTQRIGKLCTELTKYGQRWRRSIHIWKTCLRWCEGFSPFCPQVLLANASSQWSENHAQSRGPACCRTLLRPSLWSRTSQAAVLTVTDLQSQRAVWKQFACSLECLLQISAEADVDKTLADCNGPCFICLHFLAEGPTLVNYGWLLFGLTHSRNHKMARSAVDALFLPVKKINCSQ